MVHRRGFAVAGVIGVVVLLGAGCEDTGAKKTGSDKAAAGAASAAPSPSASPSASAGQSMMPKVVGERLLDATVMVQKVTKAPVDLESAYGDVTLPADPMAWTVCFQTPAADSPVTPATSVELSLVAPGTQCPERAGTALRASKTPAPTPTPTAKPGSNPVKVPTPVPPKPKKPQTPPPANDEPVYFKNCDAAKAAGKAPIRRGQPGYRDALDRDKDGIACDK
ncbi:excalibur calcium-binding domain-containing protein [Streptomyces sp. NBC_01565]|uniref:excalibur calcium-binding domain-containing protein n=1 Tax=Streptomyces sp. NBC_01565 TaxID=2975881 RepID=UPI002252C798|nr:excalibur calcium-binding domain-containing protein [Streptomyces sp. NBC_01565]